MEINQLLTIAQQEKVVKIIKKQCSLHQKREREFKSLRYDAYACGRQEHSITVSVLSGFIPKTVIPGLSITVIHYGRGICQPEIKSDRGVVLHVYNSGCGYSCQPFLNNCKKYNESIDSLPLFGCVEFTANNMGKLKKIMLRIPDKNGKFIQDILMWEHNFHILEKIG